MVNAEYNTYVRNRLECGIVDNVSGTRSSRTVLDAVKNNVLLCASCGEEKGEFSTVFFFKRIKWIPCTLYTC